MTVPKFRNGGLTPSYTAPTVRPYLTDRTVTSLHSPDLYHSSDDLVLLYTREEINGVL